MERSEGFSPVAARDARILILGSLPGRRSILEQQYYAHPQNAFWRIMRDVLGISGSYRERCMGLTAHGVALWDVLRSSVRPGSMDADIRIASAEANDFSRFFEEFRDIEKVLCNGRKAAALYERFVLPELSIEMPVAVMPSTSAAYASMRYDSKLEIWSAALLAAQESRQ